MKKLTRFLTALLLTFALFAHAEMVDTYAFKNQADRTRAVELAKSLRCPQCQNQNLVESLRRLLMTYALKSIKWWMKEKQISKLSTR